MVGAVQAGRSSTPAQPVTEKLLDIVVRGNPVGQGRISFMGKGRAVHSNAATLKPWREAIRTAAVEAMAERPPFDGALCLSASFTLAKPTSAPKTRRTYASKRPDLDHLLRAVGDALQGVAFVDDARLVLIEACKCYPNEGQRALPYPGVRLGLSVVGAWFDWPVT